MACSISNPNAPNGQPSDLLQELQQQYDPDTAARIYGEALHLLTVRKDRYSAGDLRANGEFTLAATMRLVTPLLTGRVQNGLNASISTVVDDLQAMLTPLYEGMRRLQRGRNDLRATRTILPFGNGLPEDTKNLRAEANQLQSTQTLLAYAEMLRFVDGRLHTINQLTDLAGGLSTNNLDHYHIISSLREELRMYVSPLNMGRLVDRGSGLQYELGELNARVADSLAQADEWLKDAFAQIQQNPNTTNQDLKDNADALRQAQEYGEDANKASRLFQAIGDSANSLIAAAGRQFAKAQFRWNRNSEKFKQDLAGLYGNLLQANGGQKAKLFDFMLKFDKGKATGEYVIKEGKAYLEEREKVEATLLDPNDPGKKLQYNTVKFKNAAPSELAGIKAHNKNVAELREKRRDWWAPEIITYDHNGNPIVNQGPNHRYTSDFLSERTRLQKLVKTGPRSAKWVPRLDLATAPADFVDAYNAFEQRYYGPEMEEDLAVKAWNPTSGREEYTGEVIRQKTRFVKRDYVTIQDKWQSQGYKTIYADTSALGVSRQKFYEFFMKSINEEVLRKLGPSQRMDFYGQVPRIRKNRANNAGEALRNGAKGLMGVLKPNIDWNTYTRSRSVDANGNYVDSIPIYMVGGLKSEATIAAAKATYDAAYALWRATPRDKALKEKMQVAKEQLRAAESAMEADDLETDLARSLLTFYEMAEEHHELKRLEPLFKQTLDLVEEMKFLNTDNMGNPILGAAGEKTYGKKGQASNTWKQFKDFMDLNIYNNERADSLAERIGDGMLRWSGSLMQGFNIGSQVNELVSGNINQFLQFRFDNKFSASGFLKPGAYLEAQAEVVGGTMHKGGEELLRLFNDASLLDKPKSKIEAVMEQLYIHQNTSAASQLKTGNKFADVGYKALNVFEFYTQATLAGARLRSVEVDVRDGQGNKTGETKSLWDILDFDETTGRLSWPVDSLSEEDLAEHVVQIRAMVASIHGNYNSRDRVAIQRHMLGRLAYQFKKWTYQLGRSRWGEGYYDEGLQDYREGRYRTVAKFIGTLQDTQWKIRDRWAELSVQEKINIAKTGSDLAMFAGLLGCYVLLGAAAGDDDDDDALTHRLVNFMARQADRSAGEVSAGWNVAEWVRMLKNPLPILRQFENTQAILSDFTGIGAYAFTGDEKDIIVQRGLHKGQYKLGNSLIKLLPGGLLKGQWEQSKTSPVYYVNQ